MIEVKNSKTFLGIISILFLGCILSIGCVSATEELDQAQDTNYEDNMDMDVPCGVYSSEQLLESKNISYSSSQLEDCICKDRECNADIATIRKCLKTEGLLTYGYTVNNSMLQTGDIIHLSFNNTGHYEYYIENNTDLNGFTGHIITTTPLPDQETIPPEIQKEIHGQIAPVLLVIACLENPLCSLMLEQILQEVGSSIWWCKHNLGPCNRYVSAAWAKVERGNKRLGKELKERNRVLFHDEL